MKHQPIAPSSVARSSLREQRLILLAAVCTLLLSTVFGATHTSAKTRKAAHPPSADSTPAAKEKGVSKVTHQRSASEETTAEHDRRMYRECKGMHNAGACRGYTRK